jgi:CHAD domain-containing protein
MPFDVERIHHSAHRVTKFLKKNAKRPGSKDVHGLRTSARNLETTLTTLGLDSKKPVTHLLRNLEDVRRRAGKVRDMDVLTAKVLKVRPKGELDCLVQLLEHLGAERARHTSKLRREIQTSGTALRRNVKQTARRLEKLLKQATTAPADSKAVPATLARTLQLASELQRPARLGRNNLHAYRLKVKELRNVLLLSDRADDEEFVKQLGVVKDAIGEWHDWAHLAAIAAETLDHGASCKLLKDLKATGDEKYGRALSLARHLRTHYLASRVPVLQAASVIA